MTIYSDPDAMVFDALWNMPTWFKTRGDILYTAFFGLTDFGGHCWTPSGFNSAFKYTDPGVEAAKTLEIEIKDAENYYKLIQDIDGLNAVMIKLIDDYNTMMNTIDHQRNTIDANRRNYTLSREPLSNYYFKHGRSRFLFYTAPPTLSAEWQLELLYAQENWLPLHHSTHYLDVT